MQTNYEMPVLFPSEESSQEDSLAKTYPWLENVLGWLVREAACSTKSPGSLTRLKPNGSSSKMYLAYSAVNEEQTWEQLSERWSTSGMAWPGECLMHSTSEFPKDGGVSSSLQNVLETQPVLPKFYLSAKACEGILRRAERRGKKLPEALDKALRSQCSSPSEKESQGGGKGPLISVDQSLTLATQNSQVLYEPVGTLTANGFRCDLNKAQSGHLTVINRRTAFGQYAEDDDSASTLVAQGYKAATDLVIEPTLYEPHHGDGRATEGIANTLAARMGTGGNNTPVLVEPTVQTWPIDDGREIEKHQNGLGIGNDGDPAYTLDRSQHSSVATVISPTLTAYNMDSRSPQSEESQRIVGSVFNTTGTVRRLTPTECERLQGFPDCWTEGQADTHRYKQMGNAVAVPVVEWVIQGIMEVQS